MIKQIRLKNCQSWDDIVIDLSTELLNVIVAENDTGKSVLFKLLKIVGSPQYYSVEDRAGLIRWGSECAAVGLAFDSGNVGFIYVFKDKVVYEYVKEGQTERVPSLEPSPEMLREAGLLVGNKGKFIANIIDSDQDLMLVNSNLSCNFELIRMIVMCDTLDELDEKMYGLESEFSSYWVRLSDRRNVLADQLQGMQVYDVDKMQDGYELHRSAFEALKKVVGCRRFLEKFRNEEARDYNYLEKCLKITDRVEHMRTTLVKLPLPDGVVPENYVTALQILESLRQRLNILGVEQFNDKPVFVDVLTGLERISVLMNKLMVHDKDFEVLEAGAGIVSVLECIRSLLDTVRTSERAGRDAEIELKALEQGLAEAGTEVACPIYGKVVFDGKECVACS